MISLNAREWYRSILDVISAPVLVEREERIAYANLSYARLLGYDQPSQIVGRHITAVIAAVDQKRLLAFGRNRAEQRGAPQAYPFVARTFEGRAVPVSATVSTTNVEGSCLITTVISPIPSVTTTEGVPLALSPRERTVFDLLVRGRRPKEIALMLAISPKTVATLRGRLMKKLGLEDSWDLFHFAQRLP